MPARGLAGADPRPKRMQRLEDTGHGGEHVAGPPGMRKIAIFACTGHVAIGLKHAEMGQQVPNALTADRERVERHCARSGHLRPDSRQARAHRRCRRRAGIAEIVDDDGQRRIKRQYGRDIARCAVRIGSRFDDGARQDLSDEPPECRST